MYVQGNIPTKCSGNFPPQESIHSFFCRFGLRALSEGSPSRARWRRFAFSRCLAFCTLPYMDDRTDVDTTSWLTVASRYGGGAGVAAGTTTTLESATVIEGALFFSSCDATT